MRAFDMSRYQRVIATEGDVRGKFVVHAAQDGIFKVEILDVELQHDTWGRIVRPGGFDIKVVDGVPVVGERRDEKVAHDVAEFEERINATLALVAAAFHGGPGSVVESGGSGS